MTMATSSQVSEQEVEASGARYDGTFDVTFYLVAVGGCTFDIFLHVAVTNLLKHM